MQRYGKWAPTGFDTQGLGLEDRQDWLVSPVGQNRDSDALTRSNFVIAQRQLTTADPDGDTWECHRFGHWGPGWYEILIVKPDSRAAEVAEAIEAKLEDHPALNEDHWSELEYTEACEAWRSSSLSDRVEMLARADQNILAARRDDFPEDPQGAIRDRLTGN